MKPVVYSFDDIFKEFKSKSINRATKPFLGKHHRDVFLDIYQRLFSNDSNDFPRYYTDFETYQKVRGKKFIVNFDHKKRQLEIKRKGILDKIEESIFRWKNCGLFHDGFSELPLEGNEGYIPEIYEIAKGKNVLKQLDNDENV